MNSTESAFLARGLDSQKALNLRLAGWTLIKMKTASNDELLTVGLEQSFIDSLFKEKRPPIPNETLTRLLFASRFQCCICRDPKQPIIVHHILEWSKSRSHDADNLVVLCLNHHSEAHSKKDLSQNLDADTLSKLKRKWETEVKRFDAESILEAMRLAYSNWNFINELRVFELAKKLGIQFHDIRGFGQLVAENVVQTNGLPVPVANENLFYMYQGPNIMPRYFYTSAILSAVVGKIQIVNISDWLDKGVLGFALAPGDFVFVQGAHTFSPLTDKKDGTGRGQICRGYRKANHVEIRFTFDRWEATSSSAKCEWLSGTKNQGSLVQVKDLSREDGRLVISGTVLGICSNFGDLKKREYAQSLYQSGLLYNAYGEDDCEGDIDSDAHGTAEIF